jgi:hypothetical protein
MIQLLEHVKAIPEQHIQQIMDYQSAELQQESIQEPIQLRQDANNVFPEQVADWVQPLHRIFFCLCNSLYGCRLDTLEGWEYICQSKLVSLLGINEYDLKPNVRVGIWKKGTEWFIGCRGTSFTSWGGEKDILDDYEISGLQGGYSTTLQSLFAKTPNQCAHALAVEVENILQYFQIAGISISAMTIGGHSLGGYTAICIASRFNMKCVGFNAAAPVSFPVLLGPGKEKSTLYHIVGDLISCSINSDTNTVIRAEKASRIGERNNPKYNLEVGKTQCLEGDDDCPWIQGGAQFGFIWPHIMERFLKRDGAPIRFIDSTEEDALLVDWSLHLPDWWLLLKTAMILVVASNPIPGSRRFKLYWDYFHPWAPKKYPRVSRNMTQTQRWVMWGEFKFISIAKFVAGDFILKVIQEVIEDIATGIKWIGFLDDKIKLIQ